MSQIAKVVSYDKYAETSKDLAEKIEDKNQSLTSCKVSWVTRVTCPHHFTLNHVNTKIQYT